MNNIETVQEEDSDENHMPNTQGKSQYLKWVGASDCIKDQVSGCYLTQIFELDACKPKLKPKRKLQGHLKKKQKLKMTKKGKGKDKDCLSNWETDDDTEIENDKQERQEPNVPNCMDWCCRDWGSYTHSIRIANAMHITDY